MFDVLAGRKDWCQYPHHSPVTTRAIARVTGSGVSLLIRMLPLRRSAQDSSRVGLCSTTPRRREAIRRHPSRTQQTIIRWPLTWSDAVEFDLIGTAGQRLDLERRKPCATGSGRD